MKPYFPSPRIVSEVVAENIVMVFTLGNRESKAGGEKNRHDNWWICEETSPYGDLHSMKTQDKICDRNEV